MVGWHYTAEYLYPSIKEYGLIPKPVKIPKVKGQQNGIWLWSHELEPFAELLWIINVLDLKQSTKIVKLKVNYHILDEFIPEGYHMLYTTHSIGTKHFTTGKNIVNRSVVVTKPIPPKDIEFVRTFDFMSLVQ